MSPRVHGRYPHHDVLAQAAHWDAATRAVVLARVAETPEITFFSDEEARTLRAFCDTVVAQEADPKIPVLEMIDARLAARRFDGYRYAELPDDDETWRLAASKLDGFAELDDDARTELIDRFQAGELDWGDVPVKRVFSVLMRYVLGAFYSHPWAWNEIGFGGPAYPRGYARLGAGQREPWEAKAE